MMFFFISFERGLAFVACSLKISGPDTELNPSRKRLSVKSSTNDILEFRFRVYQSKSMYS